MSYCNYIPALKEPVRSLHQNYHDYHYGFPIQSDNELFGRLIMEINQAGLSWETILKKEESFRSAYDNFDIGKVAAYDAADQARLLGDPGIIRNKLKVNAAVENAKKIMELQQQYGSFGQWLAHHHPMEKAGWVQLFKRTFVFTGGEIVGEFLMSIGFLPGAHDQTCPVYKQILHLNPMWLQQ